MALVVKDRVQETSTTTGTGTFTLAGAVSGFQSFSVIGNANTTYYAIVGGTEWEVGLGTYTSSGTLLSRDTILESSNSGSAVNFSAGTKNVFVTYPAEKSLYLDASGNSIGLGTPASATLTNATGLPLSTGVTGTLPVTNGGTGTTSTTFANLTTNVTGTLPVANGGTGATSQTAYAVLAGGTTSTGAYQSVASVGTSGQILTSNGASALPTFQTAAASPYVLKNRIINGAMVIDQRNAGASISNSSSGVYAVDRFIAYDFSDGTQTVQQVADAPAGFVNSLKMTITSGATSNALFTGFGQNIEGFNTADLAWGTASAKTVTLSFWVKSSLTGTFGGAFANSAQNRSYAFTYTISAANTWEYKTITIAGDTTGTWLTNNGAGIGLRWSLGVNASYAGTAGSWAAANYFSATGALNLEATNGATWQMTGVQLEQNTSATPFERRLYGQELANCQRYYETLTSVGAVSAYVNYCVGGANSATAGRFVLTYKVQKRSFPSVSFTTASGFSTQTGSDGLVACTAITAEHISETACQVTTTVASGLTAGASSRLITNNNNTSTISISAEL